MHVIVFEDAAVGLLAPLTTARPACDLTIGGTTLVEALGHFGPVERSLRPYLARYVTAVAGSRSALWGGSTALVPQTPPSSSHGGLVLLVNARVVPSRGTLTALRSLVEAGRRTIVHQGGAIAAALLHVSADGSGPDQAAADAVRGDPAAVDERLDLLRLPEVDMHLDMVAQLHEAFDWHERSLADTLAAQIDSGRFRELRSGLFVADGAEVAEQVVVREGPVIVDAGARIGPFVCLDGPIRIGRGARVNPHAWIRAGTVIGRECRVGGEVEATIMEPWSNKPHDGFLGHSRLGSWVNLAAGTITGNLKATYGPIRLHTPTAGGGRSTVHTGRQFLGAVVGDLVKTSINTSLPCGARIGVAATVGGSPPDVVAAFTNLVVPGGERTTAEQAAIVLGRMMERRGLELLEADRELLRDLAMRTAAGGAA
jgi:UDP-N-acetylglucosamine diphosphorylase/glucosamine-1-phosphate N-acetyltransferase